MRWNLFNLGWFAAVAALAAAPVCAHPAHVSLAEAEYDASRGCLEVALRLHPSDLEEALRRQTGRRIVLETAGDADQQILAYLRRVFVVETAAAQPAELRWVGKELSVKHVWLYFEIPLPEGPDRLEFTHRLLLDALPDQVNTLTVRHGERQATLHFTRGRPRQRLEFPPALPPPRPSDP